MKVLLILALAALGCAEPAAKYGVESGGSGGKAKAYSAGLERRTRAFLKSTGEEVTVFGLLNLIGLNEVPFGDPQANDVEDAVKKNIYVHVPRPDDDDQTKRDYQILFIKAPTFKLKPKPEEKTIVYLLSKKPEIPKPPPVKINAPEVYFIKYSTKKKDKQSDTPANATATAGNATAATNATAGAATAASSAAKTAGASGASGGGPY